MEFNPALPLPIKWNIGDDRFNEGQQVLSLTREGTSIKFTTQQLVSELVTSIANDRTRVR